MALFGRRRREEVDQLREQVRYLTNQIESASKSTNELRVEMDKLGRDTEHRIDRVAQESSAERQRISEIQQRVDELGSLAVNVDPDPTPPALPLPAPTQDWSVADQAVLTELRSRLDRLERKIDDVDGRVTATGRELASQVDELSRDLERTGREDASGSESASEAAAEALAEVQAAQTRLANEQARYQIAFRQDLADLADRLGS